MTPSCMSVLCKLLKAVGLVWSAVALFRVLLSLLGPDWASMAQGLLGLLLGVLVYLAGDKWVPKGS